MPWLWLCEKLPSAPVTISPSMTYTGVFCNNEYVVKVAKDCIGSGVPVMYQVFSLTIPNIPRGTTVISIQTMGTAEPEWMIKAGYGTFNIIIDNNGS